MESYHSSVLLKESVDALGVRKDKWYLDCTLGDGGHTIEILKQGGKVIGIDVDPEAIERAKGRLEKLGLSGKAVLVQGNFRDIDNLLFSQTELKDQKFSEAKSNLAGAVFDLGVSSLQLETPRRGFSFAKSGPLDMRMDPGLQIQALDLVNNLSRKELYELFYKLGEEKYSWQLANALVRAREVGKGKGIRTTEELADIVVRAVRGIGREREKIHPATRVFQALRMAVNSELDALEEGLEQVKGLIKNGRIVVISFHSLEDRIVKNTFREWKLAGLGEILTKKPIVPGEVEIKENSRSRSAKMRVFKRL